MIYKTTTKLFWFGVSTSLLMLLSACSPQQQPTSSNMSSFGNGSSIKTYDAPETGAQIGWGWNSYRGEAVPNLCIEFVEAFERGQNRFVSLEEVKTQDDLTKSLDMSASASVSSMGANASGKAAYAKSLKTSSFATTYILEARIDNGVSYASPAPQTKEDRREMRRAFQRAEPRPVLPAGKIRLTQRAKKLAKTNIIDFRRECGDGYVSAIHSGGRLYAFIKFETKSAAEKSKVSAEMSASGWGAEMSASASSGKSTSKMSSNYTVNVFQAGGRGGDLEIDKAGVKKMIAALPQQAADAPKINSVTVKSYAGLPDWPQKSLNVDQSEFLRLADHWGAYLTLYNDIQYILDHPDEFKLRVNATYKSLENLQDEVQNKLGELETDARTCLRNDEKCAFDETKYAHPYWLSARLPLPNSVYPIASPVQDDAAVAQDAELVADLVASEKAKITEQFRDRTSRKTPNTAWTELNAGREADTPLPVDGFRLYRLLLSNYYVRDPASQKCIDSMLDFGCMNNQEIRTIENSIGSWAFTSWLSEPSYELSGQLRRLDTNTCLTANGGELSLNECVTIPEKMRSFNEADWLERAVCSRQEDKHGNNRTVRIENCEDLTKNYLSQFFKRTQFGQLKIDGQCLAETETGDFLLENCSHQIEQNFTPVSHSGSPPNSLIIKAAGSGLSICENDESAQSGFTGPIAPCKLFAAHAERWKYIPLPTEEGVQ